MSVSDDHSSVKEEVFLLSRFVRTVEADLRAVVELEGDEASTRQGHLGNALPCHPAAPHQLQRPAGQTCCQRWACKVSYVPLRLDNSFPCFTR